jgi:hypothetical protein
LKPEGLERGLLHRFAECPQAASDEALADPFLSWRQDMDDETNTIISLSFLLDMEALWGRPKIDHAIQGELGERLRAMYEHLKAEPLPERFLEILRQLDQPKPEGRS